MTITAVTQERLGARTRVTATSDLPAARIIYHWYRDGEWLGSSGVPWRDFILGDGDQYRVSVLDTDSESFDPIANAPEGFSARLSVQFIRSIDDDAVEYVATWKTSFGDFVAVVPAIPDRWAYRVLSPPIFDPDIPTSGPILIYAEVIGFDTSGRASSGIIVDNNYITHVPPPEAPDWGFAFDSGTARVTFTEAA